MSHYHHPTNTLGSGYHPNIGETVGQKNLYNWEQGPQCNRNVANETQGSLENRPNHKLSHFYNLPQPGSTVVVGSCAPIEFSVPRNAVDNERATHAQTQHEHVQGLIHSASHKGELTLNAFMTSVNNNNTQGEGKRHHTKHKQKRKRERRMAKRKRQHTESDTSASSDSTISLRQTKGDQAKNAVGVPGSSRYIGDENRKSDGGAPNHYYEGPTQQTGTNLQYQGLSAAEYRGYPNHWPYTYCVPPGQEQLLQSYGTVRDSNLKSPVEYSHLRGVAEENNVDAQAQTPRMPVLSRTARISGEVAMKKRSDKERELAGKNKPVVTAYGQNEYKEQGSNEPHLVHAYSNPYGQQVAGPPPYQIPSYAYDMNMYPPPPGSGFYPPQPPMHMSYGFPMGPAQNPVMPFGVPNQFNRLCGLDPKFIASEEQRLVLKELRKHAKERTKMYRKSQAAMLTEKEREAEKKLRLKNKSRRRSKNKNPGSSKYRGVSWHKRDKSYIARVWIDRKSEHLGVFREEMRAALAVDERMLQLKDTKKEDLNFKTQIERDIVKSVLESCRKRREKKSALKKGERKLKDPSLSDDDILVMGVSLDRNGNPNSIEHVLSNILLKNVSSDSSGGTDATTNAESSSNQASDKKAADFISGRCIIDTSHVVKAKFPADTIARQERREYLGRDHLPSSAGQGSGTSSNSHENVPKGAINSSSDKSKSTSASVKTDKTNNVNADTSASSTLLINSSADPSLSGPTSKSSNQDNRITSSGTGTDSKESNNENDANETANDNETGKDKDSGDGEIDVDINNKGPNANQWTTLLQAAASQYLPMKDQAGASSSDDVSLTGYSGDAETGHSCENENSSVDSLKNNVSSTTSKKAMKTSNHLDKNKKLVT